MEISCLVAMVQSFLCALRCLSHLGIGTRITVRLCLIYRMNTNIQTKKNIYDFKKMGANGMKTAVNGNLA